MHGIDASLTQANSEINLITLFLFKTSEGTVHFLQVKTITSVHVARHIFCTYIACGKLVEEQKKALATHINTGI